MNVAEKQTARRWSVYRQKFGNAARGAADMRDEAHRFGITHHRNRRSKGQIVGALDGIKGIGLRLPNSSCSISRALSACAKPRNRKYPLS